MSHNAFVDETSLHELLDIMAGALRDQQLEKAWAASKRIVALRGEEYRLIALQSVVLARLHIRSTLPAGQRFLSLADLDARERSLRESEHVASLQQLPGAVQGHMLSQNCDRSVHIRNIIARARTLARDARRRLRIVANSLPTELLIMIGHHMHPWEYIFWEMNNEWMCRHDAADRARDQSRLALTAVCRRWRAVFSLGEFWAELVLAVGQYGWGDGLSTYEEELTADEAETLRLKVRHYLLKIDGFLAKGGVEVIDLTNLSTRWTLSAAVQAMRGKVAGVRSMSIRLQFNEPPVNFWDLWTDSDDCNLEQLSVQCGDLEYPPIELDTTSVTELRLEHVSIDIERLATSLPHLQELYFLDCHSTPGRSAVVLLPELRQLKIESEYIREMSYVFSTPKLVDLDLRNERNFDCSHAIFPPAPHPPAQNLQRLSLACVESEEQLIADLSRLPVLADLSLPHHTIGVSTCEALGRGLCPSLRVLRLSEPWAREGEPEFGATLVTMIRSRATSAARGERVALLEELHVQYVCPSDPAPSEEEREWLWAHLRVFTGYGDRPAHIPAPVFA